MLKSDLEIFFVNIDRKLHNNGDKKLSEEKKNFIFSLLENTQTNCEYDNLNIYYVKDYEKKLNDKNMKELLDNIKHGIKYKTHAIIREIRDNSLYIRNDKLKKELKLKEEKFKQIFQKDECNFLELLGNKISDSNDFFKLFTFDFDNIFKKQHTQAIFKLTELFTEDKLNGIITKQNIIDNNLWKTPSFNSPRDIILSNTKSLEEFIDELHVSPEYRLIKFLLENKIINHNFKDNEIDYILSAYRCCAFGLNADLEIFRNNSKYYDSNPYISSHDTNTMELKNFVNKYKNISWDILNNLIGIHIAGMRNIIFPFMAVSDVLDSRYEQHEFNDCDNNIGIFVFKFPEESNYADKFIICYFKIINNELRFYDLYDNRIYIKDAPINFERVQLLESKWAINRLISLLEHSTVRPYKKKKCDVIVYKINKKINNKDIFLISLYDKDEIRRMYYDLKFILKKKISDLVKKTQINNLIQTFIDELSNYEEITEYRLHKKNKRLFIWEINPQELKLWKDVKKQNGKIISDCITSDLYVNIKTGEENYNKSHQNLPNETKDLLRNNRWDMNLYYEAVRYNQDMDYKIYIDHQIKKFSSNKYIKYKMKYLKLKYNIVNN